QPWLFLIRKIDTAYQDYDESFPHQHKFYQFLFFDKAVGKHLIDDDEYEVANSSLHFISPHHVHYLELEEGSSGYVCMFKEELFFVNNEDKTFLNEIDLFSNWNVNHVLNLDGKAFSELNNFLELTLAEFEEQKVRKNEILLMLLKVFLIKASRYSLSVLGNQNQEKNEVIQKFLALIDLSWNKNLSISNYANELNITATYLNRLVQNTYNKTATDLLNERIILEAKRVLSFSSKPVKEVSLELGFDDPSYFSRFFKKHTKISPLQFRKKH
ncbi:MAG: helix-turn-helix domain-containing protein, partial [Vicingaceae bacterium]